MKQEDIKQLATNDLRDKITEEKNALIKLHLNHTVSPIENPLKIRSNRRLIARLKTELRKRELEQNKK